MSGPQEHRPEGARVPLLVWTQDPEPQAMEQLAKIARLPFLHHHVAVMPDVHLGIGATVGSVVATRGAVIPAAVGVDIGCGMCAVRTSLRASDLPDSLRAVRNQIERDVPVGQSEHEQALPDWDGALELEGTRVGLAELLAEHPKLAPRDSQKHARQMGTLGGGNHFIELCLDEAQRVWVLLHSGSRGIGNQIASYFIERAKLAIAREGIALPDKDLAYFPDGTQDFADYVRAVSWAQAYAKRNREAMLRLVTSALERTLPAFTLGGAVVDCHHNYVEREHHFGADVLLTRKGAVRARVGDIGIIPGSMGTRSYIVRGKGNPDSFHSCSHGAGRRMSRGKAREAFSVADVKTQTAGVECRKDAGVIDELPGAYKDIDEVMANQADLVEIAHTLKQVLCVKG